MLRQKYLFVPVLLLCSVVQAEFRLWVDKAGNAVEAEYIRELAGTVYLLKRDNLSMKVPLSGLSEEDNHYVELQNPPKFEIDIRKIEEKGHESSLFCFAGTVKKCDP